MLHWIAANTLVACGIAVLAALAALTLRRRPAAGHLLWLCVLVALIAPPLPKVGYLDGRAHAQRLATQVSTGWIELRTGGDLSATAKYPDPPAEASDVKPETPLSFAEEHAKTCKTCRRNLAAVLAGPETTGVGASYAAAPGYTVPAPLEMAAHKAAIRAKAEPPPTAEWEKADQERAAEAAAAWKPRPKPFHWKALVGRLALAGWLTGSLIAFARLFTGWRSLQALLRAAAPAEPDFVAEVASTARELGIRPPRVRMASCVRTPFIAGGRRPTLVWPRGESLDAPGARAVLAHELAHLARRDHWAAWFEAVALCLLWWHPLAHLARTQIRALSERACDAWVVWAYPDSRRDYADALVAAVERLTRLPRPVPVLGAVDSDKRTLARRLVMIMNGNIARRGSRLLAVGAITLTATLAPSWATSHFETSPYTLVRGDIDRNLQPLVEAAQLERYARTSANAEEYDQAIQAYRKLLKLRPDDAGAYHSLAFAQYHAQRYADAAKSFAKGREVAASQTGAWWQIGGVGADQARKAAEQAKKAAEEAKIHAEEVAKHAEEARAHAAEQTQHLEEAKLHAAERAEKIKAKLAEARERLAKVKGKLAESGRDADQAETIAQLEHEIQELIAASMEQPEDMDWEGFQDDFADMGEWDFDNDFDFDFDFDMKLDGFTSQADWAYDEACCHALAGDPDAAIDALALAVAFGYDDADHAADDEDLASIRDTDAFKELRNRMADLAEVTEFASHAYENEDWANVVQAYQKAARLAPKNGIYPHMLAFGALRDGDTDLAIKGWNRGLELGYNKPTMLYNLACAYSMAGKPDQALDYLAKATHAGFEDYELMKEDSDLDGIRGDSRFDAILTGVIDTAKLQREIETAIEFEEWSTVVDKVGALYDRSPEHSWRRNWAREKLALGYFYSGQYDRAEDAFADAALDHGNLQNNLYNIGCCRALGGDQAGALDYLHASVDAGWSDAEHLQHDKDLASLRDNAGFEQVVNRAADNQILSNFNVANWDQLHERATRQIAEDPENGGAHLRLGWSLIRTGRAQEAIPVFERQAELGFAPGIAIYNVACCNAILGNTDDALDALEQAIESGAVEPEFMTTDPDLKNIRNNSRFKRMVEAGMAKQKQKQADEAIPEPARRLNRG